MFSFYFSFSIFHPSCFLLNSFSLGTPLHYYTSWLPTWEKPDSFIFFLDTAEWLVFTGTLKVKIKEMSSFSQVTGMQYVMLLLWLKWHYNIDLTALLTEPYVSCQCLQLHLISKLSIFDYFSIVSIIKICKMVLLDGIYWSQCEFWEEPSVRSGKGWDFGWESKLSSSIHSCFVCMIFGISPSIHCLKGEIWWGLQEFAVIELVNHRVSW